MSKPPAKSVVEPNPMDPHSSEIGFSLWRRLLIILTIGAVLGTLIIPFNPVMDKMYRLAFLAALLGDWLGPLLLVWHRKPLRWGWLVASFLLAMPFALPGHRMNDVELRDAYVLRMQELSSTKYVWGGESSRGIDCSGLPRKALRDTLLSYGIRHCDGGALREFAGQWWFDASAKALGEGYRRYTVPLAPHGSIQQMDYSGLQPGDLAVTTSGVHILAYLGGEMWIQAEPGIGAVAILNGRHDPNVWFKQPVTTHRWSVLRHGED